MPKIKYVFEKEIESCVECPRQEIIGDKDCDDWFCDDDVRLYCIEAKRNVTVACRPYNVRKETPVPDWCPLIKK